MEIYDLNLRQEIKVKEEAKKLDENEPNNQGADDNEKGGDEDVKVEDTPTEEATLGVPFEMEDELCYDAAKEKATSGK